MKITEIKAQVRVPGRFSIFVEGKYAFSLSDMALLEEKLHLGQELNLVEVKRLKQVSTDDKLYGNALRFVAMRVRSEWEIRTYLRRKGASPSLAEHILNKLSKIGFVDDAKFAEAWVTNRRLLRPTSKRKLQQELRAKHVNDQVIQHALHESEIDEQTALRDLIAKKRARYPDNLKLMQYLARQGFSYEDIKRAIEEG
jgi:regulatory protein